MSIEQRIFDYLCDHLKLDYYCNKPDYQSSKPDSILVDVILNNPVTKEDEIIYTLDIKL